MCMCGGGVHLLQYLSAMSVNHAGKDLSNIGESYFSVKLHVYISEVISCMHHIIPTSVCATGYVPVIINLAVPVIRQDSITVSWPAPDGSQFLQNYILEVTLEQISRRKKRQADSFNRTVTAPQRSYT